VSSCRCGKARFDDKGALRLFRGQSKTEAKQGLPILYPNPGFKLKDGSDRLPDVMIVVENGKQIVKGCRSTKGDYRAISDARSRLRQGA
jgi:hypothetical protein